MTSKRVLVITDCVVDDNTIKSDGQTWNKECNTCTCNNGKVVCEPKSCDCNMIKELNYGNASNNNEDLNIKCCSHCYSDKETKSPCSDSDGQTKHQHGERWLHECQECECKVSYESLHFGMIKENNIKIQLNLCIYSYW